MERPKAPWPKFLPIPDPASGTKSGYACREMPDAEPSRAQDGSHEVDVRLSELEVRAEFQSRTVEDLDNVVREFAERVARLEHELRELRKQLELMGSEPDEADEDEP